MILPESRSLEWIKKAAADNHASNPILVEKVIRAFSLLEAMARSGCPFIFKGGSSLMLHFGSSRRLSIDIDIICPPGTDIEKYWGMYAREYGFTLVEAVDRIYRSDVPKTHAKCHYQVSYKTSTDVDTILLDVLTEDNNYHAVDSLPIKSPFLLTEGPDVLVSVPCKADLLGDKLTAFAPHTTGIPFYKGTRNCSMEIMKQMYDIASLFDVTDNLAWTAETYRKLGALEMDYRRMEGRDIRSVAEDTIATALCISTNGFGHEEDFLFYSDGITRVRNFIHSERYNMTGAVRDASKAAYAAACALNNVATPQRYGPEVLASLADAKIPSSFATHLNQLKTQNPEAFFYWYKTSELMKQPDGQTLLTD